MWGRERRKRKVIDMPKKKNLISDIEKLGEGTFSKKTVKSLSQVTIGDLIDIKEVLGKSKRRKR